MIPGPIVRRLFVGVFLFFTRIYRPGKTGVTFLATVIFLSNCRGSKSGNNVFREVAASPIARLEVALATGARVTFEARTVDNHAVPVIHLWDLQARIEVAQNQASRFFGRRAQISYRNFSRTERRYLLVVRAANNQSGGYVDIYRDGRTLLRKAYAGGILLEVSGGNGYIYQATGLPAGINATSLYALDSQGKLLAYDDQSGPLGLPRIKGEDGVRYLAVGPSTSGNVRGAVNIYANDPRDRDGDGVGRALERALGTCDSPRQKGCSDGSLADFYRAKGTRDTDRDGLSDGDELFGAGEGHDLDLPRWGTDPRHKDVFIEVDYQKRVEKNGLGEPDLMALAALFARGSAQDLRNPDCKPGVRLHLDVGFNPVDQTNAGLFGDWGGANQVKRGDYFKTRETDFDAKRNGYFRYALLTRSGTGHASGDSFSINRDFHRVPVFAHELGHTLGLGHEGHFSWGGSNCKPNYYSIMNYPYQNRHDVGFSVKKTGVLNPARVVENQSVDPLVFAQMGLTPFDFDIVGNAIDWNRDGLISKDPVRAGITWATFKSCNSFENRRIRLGQDDVLPATPALVRSGDHLHALWLDSAGRIVWRQARISEIRLLSLSPQGDTDRRANSLWSDLGQLPRVSGARELTAHSMEDGQIAVIYLAENGSIHVLVLTGDPRQPHVLSDAEISGSSSRHAPSAAWMTVNPSRYGTDRLFAIWWRAAGAREGYLIQSVASSPFGPYRSTTVLDKTQREIFTALGPTVLSLGTGELCGAFVDLDRYIRFYCYDTGRDLWINRSELAFSTFIGPQTAGEVTLGYHRYRTAVGDFVTGDSSRGAVWLVYTESAAFRIPDNPQVLVSEWLDAQYRAFDHIYFRWRGQFINQWTNLPPGTGVALYEDESFVSLQAIIARTESDDAITLDYLPFADGTYDETLGSGNDFQVMERGICTGIQGELNCGDHTTGAY